MLEPVLVQRKCKGLAMQEKNLFFCVLFDDEDLHERMLKFVGIDFLEVGFHQQQEEEEEG